MSALNRPENFAGRVAYAAKVISAGRRVEGRAFDNCFENHDGDVVTAALMRRATHNPKIAGNIFRFLSEPIVRANVATYAHVKTRDLAAAATALREQKRAAFAAQTGTRDE